MRSPIKDHGKVGLTHRMEEGFVAPTVAVQQSNPPSTVSSDSSRYGKQVFELKRECAERIKDTRRLERHIECILVEQKSLSRAIGNLTTRVSEIQLISSRIENHLARLDDQRQSQDTANTPTANFDRLTDIRPSRIACHTSKISAAAATPTTSSTNMTITSENLMRRDGSMNSGGTEVVAATGSADKGTAAITTAVCDSINTSNASKTLPVDGNIYSGEAGADAVPGDATVTQPQPCANGNIDITEAGAATPKNGTRPQKSKFGSPAISQDPQQVKTEQIDGSRGPPSAAEVVLNMNSLNDIKCDVDRIHQSLEMLLKKVPKESDLMHGALITRDSGDPAFENHISELMVVKEALIALTERCENNEEVIGLPQDAKGLQAGESLATNNSGDDNKACFPVLNSFPASDGDHNTRKDDRIYRSMIEYINRNAVKTRTSSSPSMAKEVSNDYENNPDVIALPRMSNLGTSETSVQPLPIIPRQAVKLEPKVEQSLNIIHLYKPSASLQPVTSHQTTTKILVPTQLKDKGSHEDKEGAVGPLIFFAPEGMAMASRNQPLYDDEDFLSQFDFGNSTRPCRGNFDIPKAGSQYYVAPQVRTSKKHDDFLSSAPWANQSVYALPGIGKVLGGRLESRGYYMAEDVLNQCLRLGKDRGQFQAWMKEVCNANSKQSGDCYECLRRWC